MSLAGLVVLIAMNFTSGARVSELLSLDRIRGQLIRLEDTIFSVRESCCASQRFMLTSNIVALIERAQFALNKRIYESGAFKAEMDFGGSWMEWFLFEIESFHGEP